MTKVKDFILSILLPRRMYRYHDNKIIYSVLIFVLSVMILMFSINISTAKFMKDLIGTPDFENYNYKVVDEESDKIPNYKIATNKNGNSYLDCELPGTDDKTDTFKGVFNTTLRDDSRNHTIILTTVFYEDLDLFESDNPNKSADSVQKLKDNCGFDLSGYLNQTRSDKTTYVLYVFATESFYYLYNLGQTYTDGKWVDDKNFKVSTYEYNNTDSTYKYFLPKDETELVVDKYGNYDTSFWSIETTENQVASFNNNIKSQRRIVNDIRKVIYGGEYIYNNLDTSLINDDETPANFSKNLSIVDAMKSSVDLMALCDANIQKNAYSFFAVMMNVIFPLVWVLITWLLSRRFVMNKFREYYAICSITYALTSVIGLILGFFISFDRLMLILVAIELLYYIFVTFRINTDPKLLEENKDDDLDKPSIDKPKLSKPEVNFKKVQSEDAYRVE